MQRTLFILAVAGFLGACAGSGQGVGGSDGSRTPDASYALDTGLAAERDAFAGDDAGPGPMDIGSAAPDGGGMGFDADAGDDCFVHSYGVHGRCMSTAACAALGDHTPIPGACPGPSGIECCIDAPDVGDNPPVPSGWRLMQQSAVTPDMTMWAVSILHDPVTYPMYSTAMRTFGTLDVLARVEWHPPDFQNSAIHRGVTLYQPN